MPAGTTTAAERGGADILLSELLLRFGVLWWDGAASTGDSFVPIPL